MRVATLFRAQSATQQNGADNCQARARLAFLITDFYQTYLPDGVKDNLPGRETVALMTD